MKAGLDGRENVAPENRQEPPVVGTTQSGQPKHSAQPQVADASNQPNQQGISPIFAMIFYITRLETLMEGIFARNPQRSPPAEVFSECFQILCFLVQQCSIMHSAVTKASIMAPYYHQLSKTGRDHLLNDDERLEGKSPPRLPRPWTQQEEDDLMKLLHSDVFFKSRIGVSKDSLSNDKQWEEVLKFLRREADDCLWKYHSVLGRIRKDINRAAVMKQCGQTKPATTNVCSKNYSRESRGIIDKKSSENLHQEMQAEKLKRSQHVSSVALKEVDDESLAWSLHLELNTQPRASKRKVNPSKVQKPKKVPVTAAGALSSRRKQAPSEIKRTL